MNDHLRQLVRRHDPLHGRNVAREYLQARILAVLQRAGAMTSLAFHGGTCLRFLYDLPRYSEDLNFTLEGKPANSLRGYARVVRAELVAENYRVDVRVREHRVFHSALVRFPGVLHDIGLSPHASEVLAVKIEVDTNPPSGAGTDITLVRRHATLRLHHHDRSSLLAGKLHAVLQRPWTKGRDLFDLAWYLSDPQWPAPNLILLNAALRQSGWKGDIMTPEAWKRIVGERLEGLDWPRAVADARPFLAREEEVELIDKEGVLRLLG